MCKKGCSRIRRVWICTWSLAFIRKRAFSCYAHCRILQTSRDTSCTTPAPSIRRQKAASGRYLHVRTNLFDFAWSLKAAAAAGRMKDIGHSQPWVIDAVADVCCGWLPETDLPPLLRQWTRTDTRREPCTFRGIDFEMQNLRADAGGKGIAVSALRSDADFNAVMRSPELVLKHEFLASPRTGNWRLHQREAPARSRQALLREEPHRRRVERARNAATASTATSHGRWCRSTCAASAGNGARRRIRGRGGRCRLSMGL